MTMFAIMSRRSLRIARHLKATSNPSNHSQLLLYVGERPSRWDSTAWVVPILRASCRRNGFRSVITTCRAPTCWTRRGHEADGSRAGDQHILAHHRERERRVYSVAKGIEDGGPSSSNAGWGQMFFMGNAMILCKCARPVDADAAGRCAEMPPSGTAIPALAAHHMPLAGHDFAREEGVHIRTQLDHFAHELMSHAMGTGMVFCAHSFHS